MDAGLSCAGAGHAERLVASGRGARRLCRLRLGRTRLFPSCNRPATPFSPRSRSLIGGLGDVFRDVLIGRDSLPRRSGRLLRRRRLTDTHLGYGHSERMDATLAAAPLESKRRIELGLERDDVRRLRGALRASKALRRVRRSVESERSFSRARGICASATLAPAVGPGLAAAAIEARRLPRRPAPPDVRRRAAADRRALEAVAYTPSCGAKPGASAALTLPLLAQMIPMLAAGDWFGQRRAFAPSGFRAGCSWRWRHRCNSGSAAAFTSAPMACAARRRAPTWTTCADRARHDDGAGA